jgi:hypothetical protein
MVIINVPPEYPRFLPHNYHRIHYNEFQNSWRSWDHDRHWQSQSWYQNEARPEVQHERDNQSERERMRGESSRGNGGAQMGPNGGSRIQQTSATHHYADTNPLQGNRQRQGAKQGQAQQPKLQPQTEQPRPQPQAKETKPQLLTRQPKLQSQAQQPKRQPQTKQPRPQPQAKESKPQPLAKQPKLQSQAQQPKLQPKAKQPRPQPQAKESKPQPLAKQPKLHPLQGQKPGEKPPQ